MITVSNEYSAKTNQRSVRFHPMFRAASTKSTEDGTPYMKRVSLGCLGCDEHMTGLLTQKSVDKWIWDGTTSLRAGDQSIVTSP